MRVLIVHNEYCIYGGEDAVVKENYSNLLEAGCDVRLYNVNNNAIKEMSWVRKLGLVFRNMRLGGIDDRLVFELDHYKPDVMHVHNVYPLITPRIYYEANRRGIKIVQTLHNFRFLCPNGLLFRDGKPCEKCSEGHNFYHCFKGKCYRNSYLQSLWYAFMITKAKKKGWFDLIDRFIALNPFIEDKMVANGYKRDKFVTIPNGFEAPQGPKHRERKNYLLYMGRLSVEKGILNLVKAINQTNYRLIIAGNGPLEGEVKKAIGDNENIELVGFVSGEKKERLIAEAKAIVVASKWYENLPTIVIEGFSYGTPAIVPRIGGVQYMVMEGYNGFQYEPSNERDLLAQIDRLFNTKAYEALTLGALSSFSQCYEKELIIKKLLNSYREVVKERDEIGMEKINFFGSYVSCINEKDELKIIDHQIRNKISTYIVYPNVHVVVSGRKDLALRKAINHAFIASPDGKPLSVIGRFKGTKSMERCTGPDIMIKVIENGLDVGFTHYFYGSHERTLQQLKEELTKTYPTIKIVGMYSPPFRELTYEEDLEIRKEINRLKPDCIWVGLGAPKQEIWMYNHKDAFHKGVMFGVGAAFDFHAKTLKRAPLWMQKYGLEWVYRLMQEPKRLWKRYLVSNVLLIVYLMKYGVSIIEQKGKVTSEGYSNMGKFVYHK